LQVGNANFKPVRAPDPDPESMDPRIRDPGAGTGSENKKAKLTGFAF